MGEHEIKKRIKNSLFPPVICLVAFGMSCAFNWGEADPLVFVSQTERNGNDVIGINELLLSVGEHNT